MKKILISILFAVISIASFAQSTYNRSVPVSGTDTYTTNITSLTSYTSAVVYVKFGNTNTGAATININAIGAAPIRAWDGDSWEVLTGGELDVNTVYKLSYLNGGTYFQLEGTGSGGGGGSGTVTDVSVVTANGVSGSVATSTTTPAITLTLGAITPTSVNGTTSTEIGYISGLTSSAQTQIDGKQATLVSGTNIKTVGGTSLLGSGNLTEVTQTVTNGVTLTAPSEDAVYDAIATGLATVGGYTSTAPEIRFASISGQTMKGRTLTVNKYFIDIDGTSEGSTTFQWVNANDAIGTGVANIVGATTSTYPEVTGDLTKYIACIITPVNSLGEAGTPYTTAYVGPVDDTYWPADQASPVVSYGIKKMAVAYAGNCMQVQQTNGGTTYNIGFDGNGDIDWSAISTAAAGGPMYVKIWYDQSGNGFNMEFTAFADQPTVNYTAKRIEWYVGDDGFVTHNATMNIGTGDFSFFIEATPRTLMDATFTYFEKKTNFSTNNLQLYCPIGAGTLMYTGNASTNTMTANYSTPDRRTVIAGYRSSTAKFINTDGTVKTASETAPDLTSTTNIKFNTGDGGDGEWYMWSFSMYKANYGADYSKYKKFVSADSQ